MKFWTMLLGLLGVSTIETKDGKPSLSDEQKEQLNTMLGAENSVTLLEQVTAELAGVEDVKIQLQQAKQSEADQASKITALTEKITELERERQTLQTQVAKLSEEPEDNPTAQPIDAKAGDIIKNSFATASVGLSTLGTSPLWGGKVQEISGKLMGEENEIWSINRPWNARALKGASFVATDFTKDITIDRLNGDLEDFIRQNPSKIDNIFSTYFNLPDLWKAHTVYGVADRITTATITVSEVTQPRKGKWLPKGSASIKPEEMRVRPAQIDLQFDYMKMVQIETNWINSFNREGTQAYKMTFIEYLITHYLMQARSEDADVLIRGVYVGTPEDYEYPVSYLLRNDGILKQLFDAKNANKYRTFDVGLPTYSNIVDYIDGLVQSLPDDVRNNPLQLVLSPSWLRNYKKRDEELRGQNTNYTGYPQTPRDYPNIAFVPVVQFEGSDVMIITTQDNIKPLEFKPEEKSMLTIEKDRRTVYVFGDYRLGIGLNHIGLVTDATDPLKYRKQIVWTNNVPLFKSDFFASFYDEGTGVVEVSHNRVQPAKGFTTDITKFTGDVGPILIIKGDITLSSSVKVKGGTDISLTEDVDFDLKSGGTLTLVKQANGTYTEVGRTSAPETVSTLIEFTETTIDYAYGNQFIYKGISSQSLEDILNGIEGNTVRIYGQETNTITVDSVVDKIKVNSSYTINDAAKYIDLVKVDELWVEFGRG